MSTFFGGEQLTDVLTFKNYFTPADNQEFNIYTVPVGSYALIKRVTLQARAGATTNYIIEARHLATDVNEITGALENFDRSIADAGQTTDAQLNLYNQNAASYGNYYLDEGESIRFHNLGGVNVATAYVVIVHVYKKA